MNLRLLPFVSACTRGAVIAALPLFVFAVAAGCGAAPTSEGSSAAEDETVATDDAGSAKSAAEEVEAQAGGRAVRGMSCETTGCMPACTQGNKVTLSTSDAFDKGLIANKCNVNAAFYTNTPAVANDVWACIACPSSSGLTNLVANYSNVSPYYSHTGVPSCSTTLPSGDNVWVCWDPNCSGCRPPVD